MITKKLIINQVRIHFLLLVFCYLHQKFFTGISVALMIQAEHKVQK